MKSRERTDKRRETKKKRKKERDPKLVKRPAQSRYHRVRSCVTLHAPSQQAYVEPLKTYGCLHAAYEDLSVTYKNNNTAKSFFKNRRNFIG